MVFRIIDILEQTTSFRRETRLLESQVRRDWESAHFKQGRYSKLGSLKKVESCPSQNKPGSDTIGHLLVAELAHTSESIHNKRSGQTDSCSSHFYLPLVPRCWGAEPRCRSPPGCTWTGCCSSRRYGTAPRHRSDCIQSIDAVFVSCVPSSF